MVECVSLQSVCETRLARKDAGEVMRQLDTVKEVDGPSFSFCRVQLYHLPWMQDEQVNEESWRESLLSWDVMWSIVNDLWLCLEKRHIEKLFYVVLWCSPVFEGR